MKTVGAFLLTLAIAIIVLVLFVPYVLLGGLED
jgi:hypothetical protein